MLVHAPAACAVCGHRFAADDPPVVSVLIGLLVIFSSWNLLREAVSVLMESAPASIDVDTTIKLEHDGFAEAATHA